MRQPTSLLRRSQQGITLLVALIFLVIITLIAVNSARFTSVGVRSALNEELRVSSFVSAQSGIEGALADPDNTPVEEIGTGKVYCTANVPPVCGNPIVDLPAGLADKVTSNQLSVQVQRLNPPQSPPPRGSGASLNKFYGATFSISATHDETATGQGRTNINQGLVLILNRN